jgi:glutamate-ammonia-ligase adenylyltransferase
MFRQKILSQDFISKVIEKAAGKILQSKLEDFLFALENEIKNHYFTKSSESNLLRIIQNQYDVAFFINECLNFPHQVEVLISISSNSNYLTDILVRNPEYFHWIINPSVLEFKVDPKYFKLELEKSVLPFKSFESKINAVRNLKRKEILRIGLKDIYLKKNLKEITQQLSQLANSISVILFDLCYHEILLKYNINKTSNNYVLFSLGKLGGNELNYSSDIDIVVFYDKNTLINNKIYYQQILSETILLFIETASKKTGSGFLYRVDFRLRPDGKNAPLCGSYSEYLRYYEMRGEDWERQMLIKTNFLCGSKVLYNNFLNYLSTFIYPASFSVSPVDQIRKIKSSIEKKNKSDENIKLTSGGIRDIEFSIQALQLINGGKDNSLRIGNSLDVIDKLKTKNILSDEEADTFSSAYILYRKAEHYLQLMNDQQTHNIPSEGEIAEKLAHFVGCKDLKSFQRLIKESKEKVQIIYNSIIGFEPDNLAAETYFDKVLFIDLNRARSNLEFLRTGKSILKKKQFDTRTTLTFEKIEPQLLEFLYKSITPDLVLENFARIIKTALFPQIWYEEFTDKNFFNLTLKLCERSQKAIDIFAEDKILRDEFLSRESLVPLLKTNYYSLTIKQFHFRSAIQLTAKILSQKDFSFIYNDYLNKKIIEGTEKFISDKGWKNNFFIAAMGSFGNNELSFASDIDLIFVGSEIQNFSTVQKDFQYLLQQIKNSLSGLEVDCRLRPEGKSSQLIWDTEDYKKYFSNRARIWELQAFTKCRLLYGNQNLFEDFINQFKVAVKVKDKKIIRSEMIEMRKKLLPINDGSLNLKKSSGGLYDIDFIKSFLTLTEINYTDTKLNFEELENNFNFLKQIELLNQNIFNSKLPRIPTEELKAMKLAMECEFEDMNYFTKKLNQTLQHNRMYYLEIFKL